jgi:thiosulfate dehydrogenase [quinone] large subunit
MDRPWKREEKMTTQNEVRSSWADRFVLDKRWAWFWLIVRLYVGWQWLTAGWGKVTNSNWVGSNAGVALSGFLKNAVSLATGEHPSVQSWYAWFIQNAVLPQVNIWSYVVAFGELLVGVGLILGILTGLAAFFGGFMNFNYLLAGSVSTNPILLVMEIGLMLAWRIAGWWGGDRWLLPVLDRIRIRR